MEALDRAIKACDEISSYYMRWSIRKIKEAIESYGVRNNAWIDGNKLYVENIEKTKKFVEELKKNDLIYS